MGLKTPNFFSNVVTGNCFCELLVFRVWPENETPIFGITHLSLPSKNARISEFWVKIMLLVFLIIVVLSANFIEDAEEDTLSIEHLIVPDFKAPFVNFTYGSLYFLPSPACQRWFELVFPAQSSFSTIVFRASVGGFLHCVVNERTWGWCSANSLENMQCIMSVYIC